MVQPSKQIAQPPRQETSDRAAAPTSGSGSDTANRRAKKRASRRSAPPRSAGAQAAVIPGSPAGSPEETVSPTQALIDFEIRRSMKEARRTLEQQRAQAANTPLTAENSDAGAEGQAIGGDAAPAQTGTIEGKAQPVTVDARARAEAEAPASPPATQARPDEVIDPSVLALNKHLGLMTQQLTAAHRVIGRVSAERDVLRQQVADLQGIPVEEVVISTPSVAADAEQNRPAQAAEPEESPTPSKWQRLNYFGGDDVARMRKRRQTFVLGLFGFIALMMLVGRQLGWSMSGDISRDSLTALPVLGDFMYVFLAGWMLFRVIKVSSKGVRWVFPSDDRRRRRR